MNNQKKMILVASAIVFSAVLFFVSRQWIAPRYQYGIIDTTLIAEAYNQTAEFQEIYQKLDREFTDFGQALQEETAQQVEALEKEKENQKKGKSSTAQDQIEEEYGVKLRELYAEKQAEMENKQVELNKRLNQNLQTRIDEVVTKVAKKEGVSLIISDQVVYYGGKDLTGQVLTKLADNGEKGNE